MMTVMTMTIGTPTSVAASCPQVARQKRLAISRSSLVNPLSLGPSPLHAPRTPPKLFPVLPEASESGAGSSHREAPATWLVRRGRIMVTDTGKEGGVSVIHSSSIIEVGIVYFFTAILSLGVLFELLNVIRGKN